MTEPEFHYAYLPWSLKFFVCSISIDGPKVLHRLESAGSYWEGGSAACYRREEVLLVIRVGS